jgi:hypothetical protein
MVLRRAESRRADTARGFSLPQILTFWRFMERSLTSVNNGTHYTFRGASTLFICCDRGHYKYSNRINNKIIKLPTSLPIYLPTYLPTYPTTYLPACLLTYYFIPTYLHTYLPTYQHTYLPTYIPTYLSNHPPTHPPTYLLPFCRTSLFSFGRLSLYMQLLVFLRPCMWTFNLLAPEFDI